MSSIILRNGEAIHRSRNLRGLLGHARRSSVVGVTVRDEQGALRRYEYLVRYQNGDLGRAFFADWRVAADFTANRRSWRAHIDLEGRWKALEVDSDVPGFIARYERAIAPAVPKSALGRLPVRDDVETVTYHRPPTPGEIRFGHGATHYADFPVADVSFPGTRILKRWTIGPDGRRWSR